MINAKFQVFVENKLAAARLDLITQDGFLPLFIYTDGTSMEAVEVDLEETSVDLAAELIRKYCENKNIIASALIFTAHTVSRTPSQLPHLKDVKDEPDAEEAIMTYIYTRDGSHVRRIVYRKVNEDQYWFGDEGWEVVTGKLTGRFSNPFQSK